MPVSSSTRYVALPGSEPFHPRRATPAGKKPNPRDPICVTVVVRSRCPESATRSSLQELASQLPRQRRLLDPGQFRRLYGAHPADMARVKSFAAKHRLKVTEASASRCCVVLAGTLSSFSKAFRLQFVNYEDAGGMYRSHREAVRIPTPLAGIIEAVLGLDDRPILERHFAASRLPPLRYADPREITRLYHFPAGANGRGQTIAVR